MKVEEGARPGGDLLEGFLEQAIFLADGLKLGGWAARRADGAAPEQFVVLWDGTQHRIPPTQLREDVARSLGVAVDPCGFEVVVPLPADINREWPAPTALAVWADGSMLDLPQLSSWREGHLACLGFTTFADFQRFFQNPAFRIENPVLQAYGAARALRLAGEDRAFWLAAAIVALYRCFEDGVFARADAEQLIQDWNAMRTEMEPSATNSLLRWATSMHLAAGYAHLAWGQMEQARDQFGAIVGYADRIKTWPQATTNIGIGMFIAAWLEWRRGDIEAAKQCLSPATTMFQTGTGVLDIWNWHMYEELRNALRIAQLCFGFLKRLEAEPQAHIMPPDVILKLRDVSGVLRRLIDRGLVSDEPLPRGAP